MADIRIKDLNPFSGTPSANDFLAIDSANETKKIPSNTFALDSKTKLNVTQLGSGDDLNTLYGNDKSGFYYITTGVANSPRNYAGLIVIAKSAVTFQLLISIAGLWYREYSGTTPIWGEWRKGLNDSEEAVIRTILDITANPNPRQSSSILKAKDKNNRELTSFVVAKGEDGSTSLFFGLYNTDTNGNSINVWPRMRLARNGQVYYDIPNTNNFRSAIGLSTARATFTGDYIQGQWIAKKNGNVVTIQTGNFSSVPTGTFRMDGVIPEGFRPSESESYTFISREGTPRVFALTITPAGDMIFYNYNSAYNNALPIATHFTYII